MKLLYIIMLISSISFGQSFTFYSATSKAFGAELMLDDMYGFGFAGTNEPVKAKGDFKTGDISEFDLKYATGTVTQKWCTAYGMISFGYLKGVKVSYMLGGALYARKMNFDYNGFIYHKDDSVFLKPIVGIDFSKEITKDIGIKLGLDTFNKVKIGIDVYF